MLRAIEFVIAALLAWWRGREAERQEGIKAKWAVEKANEVETDTRKLPDGDAERLLKSRWARD